MKSEKEIRFRIKALEKVAKKTATDNTPVIAFSYQLEISTLKWVLGLQNRK